MTRPASPPPRQAGQGRKRGDPQPQSLWGRVRGTLAAIVVLGGLIVAVAAVLYLALGPATGARRTSALDAGSASQVAQRAQTAGAAQKPFDAPTKTVALEGKQATYDFGLVDLGATRRVTLGLKNGSSQALRMAKVRSECACLHGRLSREEVPPGEAASLEVTFDAHKEPTLYSGRMLVLAGEKQSKPFIVTIKARVGLPLEIEPAALDMGHLVVGEERRREVRIVNNGRESCQPLYASSTAEGCVAQVPRAAVPGGGKLAIPVVLRPSAGAEGLGKADLRIQTSSSLQPALSVPVKYEVSRRYALSAGQLDFGRLKAGDKRELELTVTCRDGEPGSFVKECRASVSPAATCKTEVAYSESKALVHCTFEAGGQPGKIEGMLLLLLSGHDEPVEVALSGEVSGSG